jgi:hypothetical protein
MSRRTILRLVEALRNLIHDEKQKKKITKSVSHLTCL